MSQENVDVVRRLNAAFNSGDPEGFAEVCGESFASDAELRDLANAPDQEDVLRGPDAIQAALALWSAAFDELRADVEEYTDQGDVVVCAVHWNGRAKESPMSIDQILFDVYELRDGRIVSATVGFRSKREALEAAGLSA
jgi:ketosteroid isomerase-like protein